MRSVFSVTVLILSMLLLSGSKPDKEWYNELYRPQYHFTPEKNWMGMPAGLVYYDGEYHLFYTYNPKGNEPGFLNWGHAVSRDLIRWEHLPLALFPDNLSEDKEYCTPRSGSAIIDHNNVLGLQRGDNKTMVIFYTSFGCGQRIAFSNDKGRTWQKFAGNPIIPYDENDDARDPKVTWHEATGKWVMALYRRPNNEERQRGISFYTSGNLVNWEFQSHLPGFFETPDLVEFPVNNRPDDKKWVLFEGDGSYVIGSFDGKMFTVESIRMKSDFGRNYYAAQTWSNVAENGGRVLQVACLREGDWPGMPFTGQLTFPSELSLKRFNNGTFLIRQPVSEIETLQGKKHSWKSFNMIPGLNLNPVKKVSGDCIHIKGQFDLKNCDSFGFLLRKGKKSQGTELLYNVRRQTLSLLGSTVGLEPVDNKIYLEILMDRTSIEVYANNGRAVISCTFLPDQKAMGYQLYNTGGELMIDKMEIFELHSAWQPDSGKKKKEKKKKS